MSLNRLFSKTFAKLAKLYARTLISRNLIAPDGERPAGLLDLLDIFRRQGRQQEGLTLAGRATAAGHSSPTLARATLLLTPPISVNKTATSSTAHSR